MTPKGPVIDILICRDGDAWRLYSAPGSWRGGVLRSRGDERGDIFPVGKPDADDLDKFMFEVDAPYEHRRTSDGGIELVAKGRSAICLLVWLERLLDTVTSERLTTQRRPSTPPTTIDHRLPLRGGW
jgi:hypothetical protein